MPRLSGWTRLPGTAERYRKPDGEVVSRRQYDNARARAKGHTSYSQFQRMRKDRRYVLGERDAVLQQGITKYSTRRLESEYNTLYTAMIADAGPDRDLSWNGPLGQYLVYTGDREADWRFDVGQTDEYLKGR